LCAESARVGTQKGNDARGSTPKLIESDMKTRSFVDVHDGSQAGLRRPAALLRQSRDSAVRERTEARRRVGESDIVSDDRRREIVL
jgi:hypothetical protein